MGPWLLTAVLFFHLQRTIELASKNGYMFPKKFMFGAASGAYQVEGAWNIDGKGPNIWDTITHNSSFNIADHSNGDTAALSYYKYKDDNRLVANLGMQFYRFSISWSRIMPTGFSNNINQKGIDHYNSLIDDVLELGLKPMVTIYHWDLPQHLQNLGGWANSLIIRALKDYARVLFINFGDKVKYWLTINEPDMVCMGYEGSNSSFPHAPNVDSPGVGSYLAGHNILLAHAEVYHMYNEEFRPKQKGRISIPLQAFWMEPRDKNSSEDIKAAERGRQQTLGWFAQPIFGKFGDYPQIMKDRIAKLSKEENFNWSRIPEFSPQEVKRIRGTADFFAINHYSTFLVTPQNNGWASPSLEKDLGVNTTSVSWLPKSPVLQWLTIEPHGLRKQLNFIKEHYGDRPILITENGYGDAGEIRDEMRITYLGTYLIELLKAIHEDHINVFGYTVWSIIDNFQWKFGYKAKFGLYYVNYSDPERSRIPRHSASFIKNVISSRKVPRKYIKLSNELSLDNKRPKSVQ